MLAGPQALEADDVTAIGIGIIAVVVVLGFLISLVFAKIVAKIAVLVVVVALGFLVWAQRQAVEDKIKDNACGDWKFFNIQLDKPADVVKRCRE